MFLDGFFRGKGQCFYLFTDEPFGMWKEGRGLIHKQKIQRMRNRVSSRMFKQHKLLYFLMLQAER